MLAKVVAASVRSGAVQLRCVSGPSRDYAAPLVTALSGTRRARLSFVGFTPMPLRPELQAMLGQRRSLYSTWALAFERLAVLR